MGIAIVQGYYSGIIIVRYARYVPYVGLVVGTDGFTISYSECIGAFTCAV